MHNKSGKSKENKNDFKLGEDAEQIIKFAALSLGAVYDEKIERYIEEAKEKREKN